MYIIACQLTGRALTGLSALTGEGCRELIYAIKDHLAALKAEEAAALAEPDIRLDDRLHNVERGDGSEA